MFNKTMLRGSLVAVLWLATICVVLPWRLQQWLTEQSYP